MYFASLLRWELHNRSGLVSGFYSLFSWPFSLDFNQFLCGLLFVCSELTYVSGTETAYCINFWATLLRPRLCAYSFSNLDEWICFACNIGYKITLLWHVDRYVLFLFKGQVFYRDNTVWEVHAQSYVITSQRYSYIFRTRLGTYRTLPLLLEQLTSLMMSLHTQKTVIIPTFVTHGIVCIYIFLYPRWFYTLILKAIYNEFVSVSDRPSLCRHNKEKPEVSLINHSVQISTLVLRVFYLLLHHNIKQYP